MEAVKGLRLPSCYVEVTDNEMEFPNGEGFWDSFTKIAGSILAGVGLVTAVVGVVICFTPLTPVVGGKVFAVGALTFRCIDFCRRRVFTGCRRTCKS